MAAALLSLLAPATAQGAEGDQATSTFVGTREASTLQYGGYMELIARVSSADSSPPDGYVRFSVNGVDQGLAKLVQYTTESYAIVQSDWPVGSNPTVTAEYIGSPGFSPSEATKTQAGPTTYSGHPATGSIQFGDEQSAIEPSVPFFRGTVASDPVTGSILAPLNATPHTFEADVAGVGPVEVSLRVFGELQATVEPNGTVSGTIDLRVHPFRIAAEGVIWAVACPTFTISYPLSGQATSDRLLISGDAPAAPGFSGTTCDGHGDLVNAVFTQASAITLDIGGNFTPPPGPNTATTTAVEVTPELVDGQTTLVAHATVTSASAAAPAGKMTFTTSGGYSASTDVAPTGIPLQSDGTVKFYGPFPDGPVEITAAFAGTSPTPFLPSQGTVTVQRAPARSGIPTSGELTLGSTESIAFPAGSVLEGATFDPATGEISGAQLWTPRASTPVDTGFIGIVDALFELRQDEPADGLVSPDGTVTLGPMSITLNTPAYRQDPAQSGAGLASCSKTLTLTLTGTADEDGMHLSASDQPLPAFAPGSCSGLGGFIDPALGSTYDLSLEVNGDYRLGVEKTQVSLTSWFPQVSQQNHALFSAEVSSTTPATGEVTFYDGPTELGTAPVNSSGIALLAAPLDHIGSRSITARYLGDETHQGTQGSTTIEVTPEPDGLGISGTLQVGSTSFPIAAGSVIEPQSPAAGARLWLAPSSVDLSVPGYGPVTAEVRLVQQGHLSTVAIESDGNFSGLSGWFVLHVRKVTSADGTPVTPLGCATVVLLALKGQVLPVATPVGTEAGGSGVYSNPSCTGPGRAVTDALTNQPVELSAIVAS